MDRTRSGWSPDPLLETGMVHFEENPPAFKHRSSSQRGEKIPAGISVCAKMLIDTVVISFYDNSKNAFPVKNTGYITKGNLNIDETVARSDP